MHLHGLQASFYNRDRPFDFVPVVYDLIELIIEASLWTMDYSTFDTHTQHTRLCSNNVYLICVIVHVQMWCVWSNTCWSNPKRFLSVLYVFESDFILLCFLFLFKMHFFGFFIKNWFKGCFTRSSWLKASHEMCLREIKSHIFQTETFAIASWDVVTNLFSRNGF